jgi:hypothetical protein
VLRRLPPDGANRETLDLLRKLLRDPRQKWLYHLPVLSCAAIKALSVPSWRGLLTFQLVNDLANEHDPESSANATLALEWVARWRPSMGRSVASPIRSLRSLLSEDLEIADWLDGRQMLLPFPVHEPATLPDLPPGGPVRAVSPLSSWAEVLEHGRRQKNCIGRDPVLQAAIASGRASLYELELQVGGRAETATLRVETAHGAAPSLSEVRLRENTDVPAEVLDGLLEWLPRPGHQ